jgi:Protein of unknown function (DUF4236)
VDVEGRDEDDAGTVAYHRFVRVGWHAAHVVRRSLDMAWGYRRTRKLVPGVRLNLSKRGVGISAGRRGAHVSANTRGQKAAWLSWKGLFWRKRL